MGLVAGLAAAGTPVAAPRAAQPAACAGAAECRQQTLDALAREDVEVAHDFAWRAVQTGKPNDPELMLLLARAQSLSGRAGDALVMLRRLAERKVRLDVGEDPAFARVRNLAGWPEVAALIADVNAGNAPAAAPTPARGEATPKTAAVPPAAPPLPAAEATTAETVRFSSQRFVAGGLAYDAVSRRFLFGDRFNSKLRVVGEGLDHATDLVSAASAGFVGVVTAIAIDAKRGDLWVASADRQSGQGAIHKLQLVSGRLLKTYPVPTTLAPAAPIDLAVTGAGTIVAADAAGGRVLRLEAGSGTIEAVATWTAETPASLALGRGDGVAYVAGRTGFARVDLARKRVTAITAAPGVDLSGFERVRSHRGGLVGVQAGADGTRRLVRLTLSPNGQAVRAAKVFEPPVGSPIAGGELTLVGDDVWLLGEGFADGRDGRPPEQGTVELSVRRIALKE